MSRRVRRNYTAEFKQQMVTLYLNGKSRADIIREYDLTASAFAKWITQYNKTKSFKSIDNKKAEEIELNKLKKKFNNLEWKMIF